MLVMKKIVTMEGNLRSEELFHAVDAYCVEMGIVGITHEVVEPNAKVATDDAVAVFDGYVYCVRPDQSRTQPWAFGLAEKVMIPVNASGEEIADMARELVSFLMLGDKDQPEPLEESKPPSRLFD